MERDYSRDASQRQAVLTDRFTYDLRALQRALLPDRVGRAVPGAGGGRGAAAERPLVRAVRPAAPAHADRERGARVRAGRPAADLDRSEQRDPHHQWGLQARRDLQRALSEGRAGPPARVARLRIRVHQEQAAGRRTATAGDADVRLTVDFGSDLDRIRHANYDEFTLDLLRIAFFDAVARWEPFTKSGASTRSKRRSTRRRSAASAAARCSR